MEMKQLLLPPLLFFSSFLISQSKVDSLQLGFENAQEDTVKIQLLHELYYEFENRVPQRARETALKALRMAEQSGNGELQIKSITIYGDFLYSQSQYDSAITLYNNALELARKNLSILGETEALFGLGNTYYRKGNFEKAKEFHLEKLNIAKKAKDNEGIAGSYNSLGLIYSEQGDYTKAMEYFTKSSKMYQEVGHLKYYGITLMSIGMVQRMLGNYEMAKNYYQKSDSIHIKTDNLLGRAYVFHNLAIINKNTGAFEEAMIYNNKALESFQKLGDIKKVGEVFYNLASIHMEQESFTKAISHYQESLDISLKANDSLMIAFSNCAIGECHLHLKDLNKAEQHLLEAVKVAQAINLYPIEMDGHEYLSTVYETQGDFTKAYKSKSKYLILRDSLYTKEKRELANEIEAKYQNEQKTKEIALLASEKDLQTLQLQKRINERNGIIAFSLIVLLLAALVYNQYRIKQGANKRLHELDRLKSNFFTNVSHEFRTPLTLIKGPIEQLEQNPDEKLGVPTIKMMRRNANRLLNMVNQLLDLSKVDEGSLKLTPTEGDVYKCLRAAASSFNSHAAQRYIDYKVRIPQGLLWASFDWDKLENIVYNLLGNAFKFSEDGSGISFLVSYNGQDLQIEVGDSGKGIPEEKLPFIFDRFYQVDSSTTKEKEGSGIGLSLSKDLVELMDGTITVISEVGKGTFFTIHLPILEIRTRPKDVTETNVPSDVTEVRPQPFQLTKGDKRNLPSILLVEDNSDMRHFIGGQLIKKYKVKEAIDGKSGLQKAIADSPDLIITDLMMPKMDGLELCRKLKTDLRTSHIPVIMLTAKAGMSNKIEGLETGADDYLTKPFDAKELMARTKNLIEQRQKLRELYSTKETQIDPKRITLTSIDQRFLEEVLSLLEENYSDSSFGVPKMQTALAMSKTQLHRKLKALTNEAPGELLRNFRLKRAAQLLSQKADSVTQIAYKVGFNNLSYFAKCFKELYGVAPSSY